MLNTGLKSCLFYKTKPNKQVVYQSSTLELLISQFCNCNAFNNRVNLPSPALFLPLSIAVQQQRDGGHSHVPKRLWYTEIQHHDVDGVNMKRDPLGARNKFNSIGFHFQASNRAPSPNQIATLA